jgi:hypothetical protein
MQRNTKILLLVLGAIVFLGVGAILVAAVFVVRNADGWVDRGRQRMEAGREAGAALDSQGCVDRALGEYRKDRGPLSAIGQRIWLTGCLETATPNDAICPTIDAESTLGAVGQLLAARNAFCVRHGLGGDQGCQQLAEGIESFCFDIETPEAEMLGQPGETGATGG